MVKIKPSFFIVELGGCVGGCGHSLVLVGFFRSLGTHVYVQKIEELN